MKQMAAVKRIGALCGALVLAAGLILSGCEQPSGGGGGGGSEPPVVKKGLSFSKSQATVYTGGRVRLSLSVEGDVSYDDIAVETLTDGWDASYQSGIVTVTAPAEAKKDDSVTVTAYYLLDNAVKSSCTVTVIEKPADYIEVENITISGTLEGMNIGDSTKLTAVVTPANATSKDALFWRSSDPAVATVSQDGTVTVVGYGEAQIFAEVTADLKESNKIPVSVKIDIETLTLEKTKWRSNIWAEGENNTYYTIWFTSNTDAVVQGVTVYPNGDTESIVIGSSYDINKTEQTITIYNFGDLSIKDSFLQAWGSEFRLVPYTEPPKIINPELVKTKWTGEAGTVWFVDDTHFIWDLEGEIITGEFELKNGLIILSKNGYLFVLSEKQLRDGGGHKYTKTEWTPPPEKLALAGTKWAVNDKTIWFIDDTVCCYSWTEKEDYPDLYSYMYGSYSTQGNEVKFFGGLFTGSVDGDALKAEYLGDSAFQKTEYTTPEHDFSETVRQIRNTTWYSNKAWITFYPDYTCSYGYINNSSGSGKAIVFGYSDKDGRETVSWVESEGMWSDILMTLNKTGEGIPFLIDSNGGYYYK